MTAFSLIPMER